VYWRELSYPLVDNRVCHYDVFKWSQASGINFPADSNCVGCFWKNPQQLRKNYDDEPQKMRWFEEMEILLRQKWKKEIPYESIKDIGLQMDFQFGTGAGCQSGFCTN
jgi:hypothetical protein